MHVIFISLNLPIQKFVLCLLVPELATGVPCSYDIFLRELTPFTFCFFFSCPRSKRAQQYQPKAPACQPGRVTCRMTANESLSAVH